MKQISTEIIKRSNGKYSPEKSRESLLSLFINIWSNNLCSLAIWFSSFVFPQVQKTQFSKEAWVVGWRACAASSAPGKGRHSVGVGLRSSSSSLRWRSQPMLPGYLLGRRAGNSEDEEKGKEYTPGRLGRLWVSLKTRVFQKRKGTVNIHSLERNRSSQLQKGANTWYLSWNPW